MVNKVDYYNFADIVQYMLENACMKIFYIHFMNLLLRLIKAVISRLTKNIYFIKGPYLI